MKTIIKTLLILALTLNLQSAILNQQSYIAFAQAPEIEWAKTYGGNGADRALSVQQTTDGGYVMAGITFSSQNGDVSGQNNGNQDAWIVKTDASGTIEWEQNYGGSGGDIAYNIQQTTDGGYIVAGSSNSSNGDVGGNNGGFDFWVIKLNTNGTIQWEKNYGGSGNDFAYSIQQTVDGGYIVTGRSNSPVSGDITSAHGSFDMWVVKLHANGNIDWQKSLGGSGSDSGNYILQTTDGGYMVAGYSNSTNGDVSANHGGFDYWLVKLSANGDLQWEQNYGGSGDDLAYGIQQTTDGGYIVVGQSKSNNGDVSGNHGDDDMWVLKINEDGSEIEWQRSLGGSGRDWAYSVRQTTDGGYAVAGYTCSTDGDVIGALGNCDFWVVKLDSAGNIQWQKPMGGTNYEEARAISQTTDGGYIIAGYTESNDGDVSGNNGNNDFWVVKLESTLSVLDNSLPTVSLYPNPVKDILHFKAEKPIENIKIYNLAGQALLSQGKTTPLSFGEGLGVRINVSNLKSGIYLLEVTVNGRSETYKVIKQ